MEIPIRVKECFEGVKRQHDHVYLRNLRGRFYIYRITLGQPDQKGKRKIKSEYIGRITEEGAFVRRGMNEGEKKLEIARAIIEEHGGKVSMPESRTLEEEKISINESEMLSPSEEEQRILTILSMNGRARMKSIAKMLNITVQAATRKVKKIETKYGISYIAEIDPVKLGFLEYLVFIKFEGEKPTTQEIRDAFEKVPMVQFCAMAKGNYDVMLYVLVDVNNVDPEFESLQFGTLTSFTAEWHIKSVTTFYGCMPIRESFFELLKKRIWHREKGSRGIPQYALFQRDYKVLRELSAGGNKKFNEIDKENELPNGSARYSYYKLLEKGILKRITIKEKDLPIAYEGLLQFKLTNVTTFQNTRNNYRLDVITSTKEPYNSYSVIFDLLDPAGFLAVIPTIKGQDIESKSDALKANIKGVELNTMVITGVLVGELCHRKFDNVYSVHYENLIKDKIVEQKERIRYDKL
ncbi:MAG: hypothetical protein KGH66_02395 [Candidatus Micrarchaeota archaeon]|nr:hypothetical protein [Candidatus Micrarchaeota archaeon]